MKMVQRCIGIATLMLLVGFIGEFGARAAELGAARAESPSAPSRDVPQVRNAIQPGYTFGECPGCPKMVVIPAGHVSIAKVLGNDGRDDTPGDHDISARDVDIAQFAAGIYDVTRKQYRDFVRTTGRSSQGGCYTWNGDQWFDDLDRSWMSPGYRQTESDPVVCVNWEDAQAYVRWLNGRLNRLKPNSGDVEGPYRLLTWEEANYAAAGGAQSEFYWGTEPNRSYANYGSEDCNPCKPERGGSDRWSYTSPVGSFPPNRFGLYDAVGNVWQWTDSTLNLFPGWGSEFGVLHGGSWLDSSHYLKSSAIRINDLLNRNNIQGFRVARTLSSAHPIADVSEVLGSPSELAGNSPAPRPPGSVFRDCPSCPVMVVLPSGSFRTRAKATDDIKNESEVIRVTIGKPFAFGKYDVTKEEYAAFVKATGRTDLRGCQRSDPEGMWNVDRSIDWERPGFKQTGRDPVVCVSWNDAQAYVTWLNTLVRSEHVNCNESSQCTKLGSYRLPSWEEWEYAARGGGSMQSRYYWGSQTNHNFANYGLDQCAPCGLAKEGRDRWYFTSPVGAFPPNVFGLYEYLATSGSGRTIAIMRTPTAFRRMVQLG